MISEDLQRLAERVATPENSPLVKAAMIRWGADPGAVSAMTPEEVGNVVTAAWYRDPFLAASITPEHLWVSGGAGMGGRSQLAEFGSNLFGLVNSTLGAAGGLVGSIGTTAQANAADAAAIAEYNKGLAGQVNDPAIIAAKQRQMESDAKRNSVLLYVGIFIVVVALIMGLVIANRKGAANA